MKALIILIMMQIRDIRAFSAEFYIAVCSKRTARLAKWSRARNDSQIEPQMILPCFQPQIISK